MAEPCFKVNLKKILLRMISSLVRETRNAASMMSPWPRMATPNSVSYPLLTQTWLGEGENTFRIF